MAMKWVLIITILVFLSLKTCTLKNPPGSNSDQRSAVVPDTMIFTDHVQPILEKKCSPCHFPGGKMYVLMPFDQDSTLLNHQNGILKRMNKEETAIIKKFITQAINGSTDHNH